MRVTRSVLGMAGITATLLAATLTTGPAQAAAPEPAARPAARVLVAPAAPEAASSALAAAASPRVSPGAPTSHVPPGGTYSCASGNLCAFVWDPTTSDWKMFHLNACNRYYMYDWNGNGWYFDNQTGNVTSYLYNQGGGVVKSFKPGGGQTGQDWTPIWSIRNC